MADDRPHIEKLSGKDNWSTWQYVMKTIMECDGLLDVYRKTAGTRDWSAEL